MTETGLHAAFNKHGVQKVAPLGDPFDPNFHEAVMQVEDAELEANTVCEVLQAGYTINGRVIRPARVSVTKKTEAKALE